MVAAGVLVLVPWPCSQAPRVVPAASPFVGIAVSLASRSLGPAAAACALVLVLSIARRRWFCRWACPVGLMTEAVGRVSPISPSRCRPVPRIGLWIVLLSLSAAAAGYPLLLWLDPLALFSATLGLARDFSAAASQAAAAILVGILLVSYGLPGTWCLKLCPLGATQELLASPGLAVRRLRGGSSRDSARDELIEEPLGRRSVLTTAVGAACVAGLPLGLAGRAHAEQAPTASLRPPGAAPPWQFGQLCLRCGNCVRACPPQIIRTRWQLDRWQDWLLPEVALDDDYCRAGCFACMEACPSGALAMPSSDRAAKPAIGLACVLMDRCLLAQGSECRTMCLDSCPYEAITLHPWTWEDARRYPMIASDRCPGCGACQVACTPMDAIVVRPVPQTGVG